MAVPIQFALGNGSPVVSDWMEVVDAVVSFANGDSTPPWRHRARFETLPDGSHIWLGKNGKHIDEAAARTAAECALQNEREFAKEVLDIAAAGRKQLMQRVFLEVGAGKQCNLMMLPSLISDGRTMSIRFSLFGSEQDSRGWVLFAAAALAQRAIDETTELGRCRYVDCNRFFVIKRGTLGKPRTQYCKPEHREAQHAAGGARRKDTSRKRARQQGTRRK